MNFFFFVILCILGVNTALAKYDALFREFQNTYDRQYYSDEELEYRSSVFKENLRRIESHNSQNLSWTMGMNKFGDMTAREFAEKFINGLDKSKRQTSFPETVNYHGSVNIPDSIDWRTRNAVTPVKNQGECGSCWAFSTTGAVEGAHSIAAGKLVSLSEQQLVDCCEPEGSMGCKGGLMDFGFQCVIDTNGICGENEYSYKAVTEATCAADKCIHKATISKFVDVEQNNQLALKAAVSQQPVSVAIEADAVSLQFYRSGVYDPWWCGIELDHGVLVVGYGTLANRDFWLVKNSWGQTWGTEEGYIKIARTDKKGTGKCGIAMQPSYPIASRERKLSFKTNFK